MRRDYQKFTDRRAEVIAIGPENAKRFTEYWRAHDMPFPGIPDPQHRIASLYGQQVKLLKLGRMPALVVIDKEGRMLHRHFADSMSDIPDDEKILAMLDGLNQAS